MVNQRQSPRAPPLHLRRTTCSEASSLRRPAMERGPKLLNRNAQIHEKKRGSRVAELETSLSRTVEELKKLNEQLASAETAKTDARKEIEKLKTMTWCKPEEEDSVAKEKKPFAVEHGEDSCLTWEAEVITKEVTTKEMAGACEDDVEVESRLVEQKAESETIVTEKGELEMESAAARRESEELQKKLEGAEEELRDSKETIEILKLKLLTEKESKASLEADMRRLSVQSEQWRKAAEAAAAALVAGDVKRCGPLESSHLADNYVGRPPLAGEADVDEGTAGQKSRGGIRFFGDLWKKKVQQK